MQPDRVVVVTPHLDQHLGLVETVEDLPIQQLFAQVRMPRGVDRDQTVE